MNNSVRYNVETFNKLPERAKELIFEHKIIDDDVFSEISCYIDEIESPIEKILLTALAIYCKEKNINLYYDVQYEINVENKKYVADFYIRYDERINRFRNKDFKLVIECDGHDYHHINKEQVTHDYERENTLKTNGYDVIRFTGSQIYKEPIKCVEDIIKYIKTKNRKDKR